MNKKREYGVINTFSRFPVIPQIATYILFMSEVITFFICIDVNFKSSSSKLIFLILFLSSSALQIITTIASSYMDPSDNLMIKYVN